MCAYIVGRRTGEAEDSDGATYLLVRVSARASTQADLPQLCIQKVFGKSSRSRSKYRAPVFASFLDHCGIVTFFKPCTLTSKSTSMLSGFPARLGGLGSQRHLSSTIRLSYITMIYYMMEIPSSYAMALMAPSTSLHVRCRGSCLLFLNRSRSFVP